MIKRGKAKPTFERRSIETFSGFKTSDGKTWSDRIQAIGVQAKLDLEDIICKAIDWEDETFGNLMEVLREDRDLIIELMTEAFMTPDEISAKMDAANAGVPSKGKHGVGSELPDDKTWSEEDLREADARGAFKAGWKAVADMVDLDEIENADEHFDRWYATFRVIDTNADNLKRFYAGGLSPAQAERVEGEAQALYNIECSHNPKRFPLWGTLTKSERRAWLERAAIKLFPQKPTIGEELDFERYNREMGDR